MSHSKRISLDELKILFPNVGNIDEHIIIDYVTLDIDNNGTSIGTIGCTHKDDKLIQAHIKYTDDEILMIILHPKNIDLDKLHDLSGLDLTNIFGKYAKNLNIGDISLSKSKKNSVALNKIIFSQTTGSDRRNHNILVEIYYESYYLRLEASTIGISYEEYVANINSNLVCVSIE